MADNKVQIIISAEAADAQKAIDELGRKLREMGADAKKGADEAASGVDRLGGGLSDIRSLAATLGLAAAFREGAQAIGEALRMVDDYRKVTISIAATLTDSVTGTEEQIRAAYARNLAYAQDTYSKVEAAAAKYFASGREMVEAWQILAVNGVPLVTDKDIDNLGVVVDKIKLVTQGQSSSLQIAQELRSTLQGHAVAGSSLALILKDKLGPEWEDQLKKAVAQGRALEFISEQFKGIKYATEDVSNTLEAQFSTTTTYLGQIVRSGFTEMHQDAVGWLKQQNEWLNANKGLIGQQIDLWYKWAKAAKDAITTRPENQIDSGMAERGYSRNDGSDDPTPEERAEWRRGEVGHIIEDRRAKIAKLQRQIDESPRGNRSAGREIGALQNEIAALEAELAQAVQPTAAKADATPVTGPRRSAFSLDEHEKHHRGSYAHASPEVRKAAAREKYYRSTKDLYANFDDASPQDQARMRELFRRASEEMAGEEAAIDKQGARAGASAARRERAEDVAAERRQKEIGRASREAGRGLRGAESDLAQLETDGGLAADLLRIDEARSDRIDKIADQWQAIHDLQAKLVAEGYPAEAAKLTDNYELLSRRMPVEDAITAKQRERAGLQDKLTRLKSAEDLARQTGDAQGLLLIQIESLSIQEQLARTEEERAALAERRAYAQAREEGSVLAGARQGLRDYFAQVEDTAEGTRRVVAGIGTKLTDSLVQSFRSGKLEAKGFFDFIASEALRMATNKLITAPLMKGLSGLLDGMMGGGATPGSYAGTGAKSDAAYGLEFNALGGAYAGGLSAFSNSIVSRPTLFGFDHVVPFAKGAGLMGEAGPEAIMPLTRTSGGALGVRAVGGGRDLNLAVNVTVADGKSGPAQPQASMDFDGQQAVLDIVVSAAANNRGGFKYSLREALNG